MGKNCDNGITFRLGNGDLLWFHELPRVIQLVLIPDHGYRKHHNNVEFATEQIYIYVYLGQNGNSISTFKINLVLGYLNAKGRANLV